MRKKSFGFTLIEILIVITALALLTVIGSNLFFGSLLGSSKSEILREVRQNGEYALKVMEETIKNAARLEFCDSTTITVKDQNNQNITFKVLSDEDNIPRIASNSSYLTNNKVKVTNFTLGCANSPPGLPPKIEVNFIVEQKEATDRPEKKASMQFSTTVTMRNF